MDPATMLLVAAGIAAVGSLFKGVTSFIGGEKEAKQEKFNALTARQEGQVKANIALEEGDRVSASAAVNAAASGGGVTGSALNVLEDLGRQSSFNARSAIYEGNAEALAHEYKGKVAKAQGRRDLISGVVQAGSSFLSTAGQVGQAKQLAGASAAARSAGQSSSSLTGAGDLVGA